MKTKIILAATVLLTTLSALAAPPTEEGKTIFAARCAACHNVNKIVVGPALAGVDQRRSIDWIVKFVNSSQTVIKSGDPYAVDLFNKFKVQMPDHPDLTADNIKSIVEYIKAEASAANEQPVVQTEQKKTDYINLILTNRSMLFASLALIAVLILSLVLLVKVQRMKRSRNL